MRARAEREDARLGDAIGMNNRFESDSMIASATERVLRARGRVGIRPLITRVAGLDAVATILGRPKSASELKTLVDPRRERDGDERP